MSDIIIKIKGLKAGIEGKEILKGIDLEIRKGGNSRLYGA